MGQVLGRKPASDVPGRDFWPISGRRGGHEFAFDAADLGLWPIFARLWATSLPRNRRTGTLWPSVTPNLGSWSTSERSDLDSWPICRRFWARSPLPSGPTATRGRSAAGSGPEVPFRAARPRLVAELRPVLAHKSPSGRPDRDSWPICGRFWARSPLPSGPTATRGRSAAGSGPQVPFRAARRRLVADLRPVWATSRLPGGPTATRGRFAAGSRPQPSFRAVRPRLVADLRLVLGHNPASERSDRDSWPICGWF
jgi:hypothetical protein